MLWRLVCRVLGHDWFWVVSRDIPVVDHMDWVHANEEERGQVEGVWHRETDWYCPRCSASRTGHSGSWRGIDRPYRLDTRTAYFGPPTRISYPPLLT